MIKVTAVEGEGGRLRRFVCIFGVCAAVATGVAAAAGASPVPGGERVQYSLQDDVTTNFLLPDGACSFAPAAGTVTLTAAVRGWQGPILDDLLQNRVVSLNANVDGTVDDLAGNRYRVSGTFSQDGLTTFPLSTVPFDGVGRLTIAGPGGTLVGDAAFRVVEDFPLEWDFWFTAIKSCSIR